MIETVIFVGAMLCLDTPKETICQNKQPLARQEVVFHKTMTHWQKITSETIYNDSKEVKLEQKNTGT